MQTVADMRGVGVKNRGKSADVLCGRPLPRILRNSYGLAKYELLMTYCFWKIFYLLTYIK